MLSVHPIHFDNLYFYSSSNFLISFEISSLIHLLFMYCPTFTYFEISIDLLLVYSLIFTVVWEWNISILFNLLSCVLWPRLWSGGFFMWVWEKCMFCFWMKLSIYVHYIQLIEGVVEFMSSLIFCLLDLFLRGV